MWLSDTSLRKAIIAEANVEARVRVSFWHECCDSRRAGHPTVHSSMRQGSSYTPYYCEENVYKLCERLLSQNKKDLYVVFISNQERQVADPACHRQNCSVVPAPSIIRVFLCAVYHRKSLWLSGIVMHHPSTSNY